MQIRSLYTKIKSVQRIRDYNVIKSRIKKKGYKVALF